MPKNAEEANRNLAAGLRKSADELEPLKEAAAAGDVKAVLEKARRLASSRATRQVLGAYRDLQARGYALKPIGG